MADVEPADILDVLKILVTPDKSAAASSYSDPPTDSKGSNPFQQLLSINLATFWKTLESQNNENLKRYILHVKETLSLSTNLPCSRWDFVLTCLLVLCSLQKSFNKKQSELDATQRSQGIRNPQNVPPVSAECFSVAQQKTILTAVQFIVILGIAPNLQPGVGIPIERRSEFSRMVSESEDGKVSHTAQKYYLLSCVKTFMRCIKSPSLGALILSRHLQDLLAALLQLIHGYEKPTSLATKHEMKSAKEGEIEQIGQGCIQKGNNSEQTLDLSKMSPASLVDLVTKRQVEFSVEKQPPKCPKTDNSELCENSSCAQHTSATVETSAQVIKPADESTDDKLLNLEKSISQIQKQNENEELTNRLTHTDLQFCEDSLKEILQRVYQPMLVREILILQGGPGPSKIKQAKNTKPMLQRAPRWLRLICGRILTDILMKPKGVLNVLLGMLEDSTGTAGAILSSKASDWRKCDAVAKVIACCPMQSSSVEDYYKQVAPQVLELLHYKDKQITRELLRVTCSTIANMSSHQPDMARKFLIQPLLQPLLSVTQENDIDVPEKQVIIVAEKELSHSVEDIHKIFVSGAEPASSMMHHLLPVCQPLFQLFCHTKNGVSHLRSACQEILVVLLKHMDKNISISILKFLCLDIEDDSIAGKVKKIHQNVMFAPASNGGVVIVTKSKESFPVDQQSMIDAMVDLLKDLQKDGVAGDFLLVMLQELTSIISEELTPLASHAGSSSTSMERDLLNIEKNKEKSLKAFNNKLMVLNLTATMCEVIGPSCLKNTKQTLSFIKVTLERSLQVCSETEEDLTSAFENETLTMALGLLTAVLSGAVQVSSSDREEMKNLMPLLEKISEEHYDPSVQEMTSDLRIAIATHGAVWSERMKQSTDGSKFKKKTKSKQTQEKSQSNKTKPLIQVLEDNDKDSKRPSTSSSSSAKHNTAPSKTKESVVNESGSVGKGNPPSSDSDKSSTTDESNSELQQAFKELCDPLIPVQGHALITLCKLIQRKDAEVMKKQETVLKIFEENLNHSDSYIYLASVNGLVAMANMYPNMVIPKLTQEFAGFSDKNKHRGSETRMKIGECLVQTSRNLGDLSPKYSDVIMAAILTGAKDSDAFVRASSMANLGEICKVLKFSLGRIVHEVFNCCSSLLKSDSDTEVRKASASVITLLLQGLGENAIKVLDSLMKEVYRLLKLTLTTEKDEGVHFKILEAYNEMDKIMRGALFPKQTLQKKIRVLDPD